MHVSGVSGVSAKALGQAARADAARRAPLTAAPPAGLQRRLHVRGYLQAGRPPPPCARTPLAHTHSAASGCRDCSEPVACVASHTRSSRRAMCPLTAHSSPLAVRQITAGASGTAFVYGDGAPLFTADQVRPPQPTLSWLATGLSTANGLSTDSQPHRPVHEPGAVRRHARLAHHGHGGARARQCLLQLGADPIAGTAPHPVPRCDA